MIEIMTFRLKTDDDADVDAFLAADRRVQTGVAYRSPGLVRRTTARNGDRWLVLQVWSTTAAADDGALAVESAVPGRSFLEFIDRSTVSIERFDDLD